VLRAENVIRKGVHGCGLHVEKGSYTARKAKRSFCRKKTSSIFSCVSITCIKLQGFDLSLLLAFLMQAGTGGTPKMINSNHEDKEKPFDLQALLKSHVLWGKGIYVN